MKISKAILLIALPVMILGCNSQPKEESADTKKAESTEPKYKEENITYSGDNTTMTGYVVYDENNDLKRPAVLVVHEWWGLNDYPKMRARELAKLGYVAMAIDVYGNGKTADNPDSAGKLAMAFSQDPKKAKARIDAAIAKIKSYAQVDSTRVAAVGYCFGGGILLNTVRLGDDLKGVVSFHGSLNGTPVKKELLKAQILICHGAADPFVPKAEVDKFKKQMDSVGAPYTLKPMPTQCMPLPIQMQPKWAKSSISPSLIMPRQILLHGMT